MDYEKQLKSKENLPFVDAQHKWVQELRAAHKEVRDFHERGEKIIKHYTEDKSTVSVRKYPLFNNNVNILENALFARIPRPDVSRRFKDPDDQVGRVAGQILQRALITEIESVTGGFQTTVRSVIKDLLVPGAGFCKVSYEASLADLDPNAAEEAADLPTASPIIKEQQTPITYVHWKDVRWSPCRTPHEMRWMAFRAFLNEETAKRRFGDKAEYLSFSVDPRTEDQTGNEGTENKLEQLVEVWEIWCRQTMKVYFICEQCDLALDITDDPLGLPEFFPAPPEFLVAHTTNEKLLPVADFTILQDQYNELNEVNARISNLVRSCRLKGMYDSSIPELANFLENTQENEMVGVKGWSSFADKGGLKGSMDFLPLEQIVTTLGQLEQQREAIKQQIYELTGISDIVRGSTSPYETAAAQGMKMQTASIRLQGKQSAVAEYLTSIIQRKAFLMLKFYEPERLLQRCGTLPQADQQFVGPALQLLQNDLMTSFRLEISSDALQQPNWTREQQERTQTITALSQLLTPVVQQVPGALQQLAPLYAHIIKWGMAGSSGARDVEGVLEMGLQQMMAAQQQPQEPKPDPAVEVAKAKLAFEQQKFEAEQQLEQQKAAGIAQQALREFELKRELALAEIEMKKEIAMAELQLKGDAALADHELKGQLEREKLAVKQVPQVVGGNIGLDEEKVIEIVAGMQEQTVAAVAAVGQSIVSTMSELANQPDTPAQVTVKRNDDGSLSGIIE